MVLWGVRDGCGAPRTNVKVNTVQNLAARSCVNVRSCDHTERDASLLNDRRLRDRAIRSPAAVSVYKLRCEIQMERA